MVVVDFYHLDPFEIFEYWEIHRNMECECRFVLPADNTYLDRKAAERMYAERGIEWQNAPSKDADLVITTQWHNNINLPEYRHAISCRLMYSLTDKRFGHNIGSTIPFDVVVCPGAYSRRLLERYTEAVVGGFPKYDPFFRGEYDKKVILKKYGLQDNGRKNVLVLPTWAEHASYGKFDPFLKRLTRDHNVILKPHHVSVRSEQKRFVGLEKAGVRVIRDYAPLPELLVVSDIVISDAISGAYWESIFLGLKPTLGLMYAKDHRPENMETKIDEYGVVNRDPGRLERDFERALDYAEENRARLIRERGLYFSNLDGSAGRRTAEALLDIVRRFNKSRMRRLRHAWKWRLYSNLGPGESVSRKAALNIFLGPTRR